MTEETKLTSWEDLKKELDKPLPRWKRAYYSWCRFWSYVRHDIHQGVYGVWFWLPYAWRWRPWDYAFALDAMRKHFVELEKSVRYGYHDNGAKYADQIQAAIDLIDKHRDDAHCQDLLDDRINAKEYIKRTNADWKLLFKTMSDNMRHWWD